MCPTLRKAVDVSIVALTGSTGFLGSEFLRTLCLMGSVTQIIAFVPETTHLTAAEKLDRLYAKWKPEEKKDISKITVVPLRLGGSYMSCLGKFSSNFNFFFHLAGLTDLNPSLETARRNNVFATQEALRIAEQSPVLERFIHLSTAYVCGERDELIKEDDASVLSFNNHYERTKYESELAVKRSGIPFTIIRPSIIVGRSTDGFYPYTKVIYSLWKAWLRGIAPRIPVDSDSCVDIVPLDWVCSVIWELSHHAHAQGEIFHACAGEDRQKNLYLIEMASRIFEIKPPQTCPQKVLKWIRNPIIAPLVPYDLRKLIDEFSQLLIYMNSKKRLFSMEKTNTILSKKNLQLAPFDQWGEVIFNYCRKSLWGKNPHHEIQS